MQTTCLRCATAGSHSCWRPRRWRRWRCCPRAHTGWPQASTSPAQTTSPTSSARWVLLSEHPSSRPVVGMWVGELCKGRLAGCSSGRSPPAHHLRCPPRRQWAPGTSDAVGLGPLGPSCHCCRWLSTQLWPCHTAAFLAAALPLAGTCRPGLCRCASSWPGMAGRRWRRSARQPPPATRQACQRGGCLGQRSLASHWEAPCLQQQNTVLPALNLSRLLSVLLGVALLAADE